MLRRRLAPLALALALATSACSSADGEEAASAEPDTGTGFTPAGDDADVGAGADTGEPAASDSSGIDAFASDTPTSDVRDAASGGLTAGCSVRATASVNLRQGPSTTTAVLHLIPSGDLATVVSPTPQSGFLNVSHGGETGWSSAMYFEKTCAALGDAATSDGGVSLASIDAIAMASSCYKYSWQERGQMPRGYGKGMARTFARAVCNPTRSDVALVGKAKTTDGVRDVLAWYATEYAALGMSNDVAGIVTARHVYALLIGLGMRESSGEHCCGRDTTATNTSSSSAEAGAWQTSYDSHGFSTELDKLFAKFRANEVGCFLDAFADGVTCNATNWENWGTGADGLEFQRLSKECPSFSAEYAAMMLRLSGGSTGHYGPLRRKDAELRPECDAMLQQVQTYVEANPSICASL